MSRWIVFTLLGVLALAVLGAGTLIFTSGNISEDMVLHRQILRNGSLEIRTTHYVLPWSFDGQCVAFEGRSASSAQFKKFLTGCNDLAEDFAKDDLHFIDSQHAYLTYSSYVASTVNAGQTWFVFHAWTFGNCASIKKFHCLPKPKTLKITHDGSGKLDLHIWSLYPAKKWTGTISLATRDFGKTWQATEKPK